MKKILIILLCFTANVYGQGIIPAGGAGNPTSVNVFNGNVQAKVALKTGGDTSNALHVANLTKTTFPDTVYRDTGLIVCQDDLLWYYTGTHWVKVDTSAGGGPAIPADEIAVGTGAGITSSPDFTYGGHIFKAGFSSHEHLALKEDSYLQTGDLGNRTNGGFFKFGWDNTHPYLMLWENAGVSQFLNLDPNTGYYGIGDGVAGSTPVGNGTKLEINDATKSTTITGAIAYASLQEYTGSSNVTINDGIRCFRYNPASLVAAATITMPPNPVDGEELLILFGGTITTGAVITSGTFAPNSGQSLIGLPASSMRVEAGVRAKYFAGSTTWQVYH